MRGMTAGVLAGLVAMMCGCQSARMARPEGLKAEAAEWAVEGRAGFNFDGAFTFGPYRADDVQRGWKRTTRFGIILGSGSVGRGRAGERYEFTLRRAGEPRPWVAQCAAGMNWTEAELNDFLGGRLEMTFAPETTLTAVFDAGTNAPAWRLAAGRRGADLTLSGALSDGTRVLRIAGSRALEGTPITIPEATGYVFFRETEAVAAVDVVNEGRVWVDPALPADLRDGIAAASAALLLFRELK